MRLLTGGIGQILIFFLVFLRQERDNGVLNSKKDSGHP